MARRYCLLAVAALLLIPVTSILGAQIGFAINPEIAAGHPDYVRNFRLLTMAKGVVLLSTVFVDGCLWLLCCAFLLKAKSRSFWWLPLAIAGPLGLAAMAMLGDGTTGGADSNERRAAGTRPFVRAMYEVLFFVVAGSVAFAAMVIWREIMIVAESIWTGVPVATIVDQQNASSGMWAFGEILEIFVLVALLYLSRPIALTMAGSLGKSILSSRRRDENPLGRDAR